MLAVYVYEYLSSSDISYPNSVKKQLNTLYATLQTPKHLSFPPETNPLVVSLKAGLTLHVIQAQLHF